MKKVIKSWIYGLIIMITLSFVGIYYLAFKMPDVYYVEPHENQTFSLNCFSVCPSGGSSNDSAQCLSNKVCESGFSENHGGTLKFLNILPVRKVEIKTLPAKEVIPCGTPFGVKIYTKGALVIGTSGVKTVEGFKEPWKTAGIRKGDIIIEANSEKVNNNDDLERIIQNCEGREIKFKLMRENNEFESSLAPIKSTEDEKYRIGIWVRDSSAGIGTLTFCEKDNKIFAGLGHGICDMDTTEILPLSRGDIVGAVITDTVKGRAGVPGELKGCFTDPESLGQIYANTETGLYGTFEKLPENMNSISVCTKQKVRKGPAKILTTIEGTVPCFYDINIDSINYDVSMPTQNMKISVTDSCLLEKTGGIVQGMSGSPIFQNGMLVGAVTHVFVNNPKRGYAIFAETMLTNSNILFEANHKNAS